MSSLELQVRLHGPLHSKLWLRTRRPLDSFFFHKKPQKFATVLMASSSESEPRRSSNYAATIWTPQLIESLQSPYDGGHFDARIEELKQEVKQLLTQTVGESLARLDLIDSIRRLGLAYHFKEDIDAALARFYVDGLECLRGLKETALCFRLLREHGRYVSSDVFEKFREEEKGFMCVSRDIKGLLSLYEATHLSLPGERILEEAKEFSIKRLQSLCSDKNVDPNLVEQVRHSLEFPTYWLMPRLEARHYIDYYEKEIGNENSRLLELAKLDFNVVQASHQREIKELSRWWQNLALADKVGFSRDRIVECYLWVSGTAFEPQFSKFREVNTKLMSIMNVIDDFYDVYSTLEEAKIFTTAIKKWDLVAMEDVPDYVKLGYFASYNLVNEISYDVLKDYGFFVQPLLAKELIHLCGAYLKEAQWFHHKITPSLEEYLENGCTSIGISILFANAFYIVGHNVKEESWDHVKHAYRLIYLSSLLSRLIDDLAPSKAEMEGLLAIQCYMKDSGETYESSKEFIKNLINKYLMELNKETLSSVYPRIFVDLAINSVRACFTIFQKGDGIGSQIGVIKDRIRSLFLDPIAM